MQSESNDGLFVVILAATMYRGSSVSRGVVSQTKSEYVQPPLYKVNGIHDTGLSPWWKWYWDESDHSEIPTLIPESRELQVILNETKLRYLALSIRAE